MIVYVVTLGYSGAFVELFSTWRAARNWIETQRKPWRYDVEEWEVRDG